MIQAFQVSRNVGIHAPRVKKIAAVGSYISTRRLSTYTEYLLLVYTVYVHKVVCPRLYGIQQQQYGIQLLIIVIIYTGVSLVFTFIRASDSQSTVTVWMCMHSYRASPSGWRSSRKRVGTGGPVEEWRDLLQLLLIVLIVKSSSASSCWR